MGPELRQVVQTIMSDLGMGEDQSKIDALEHDNISDCLTKALELADWNNVGMRMKGYAPIWPYNRL